ncbi:MAG: preprotein translocase subunit YajC [Candidatus Nanopelagicales bacterium]
MDGGTLTALLPLIVIAGAFYFLIIRPTQRRQRDQLAVVNALAPGARVMTTAGLFGTVVEVDDSEVSLEIAPGVVVRYVKAAIAKVVEPAPDAAGTAPAAPASDAEAGRPTILDDDTKAP